VGYPDLPVFLGVGRFKGYWSASTNSGTLAVAPAGGYEVHDTTPLFSSGSTYSRNPNALGGYDGGTNLTATLGDFWKVTAAGTTPVDGEDAWRISDFVVFTYNSGSTSGSIWQKLSYTDTISSIVVGNGSGGSTKFGVSAADVHEFTGSIYVSGNIFAEEINTTSHNHTVVTSIIEKSGSTTFGDSSGDIHQFTGSVALAGNLIVDEFIFRNEGDGGPDSGDYIQLEQNVTNIHAGALRLIQADGNSSPKVVNVGTTNQDINFNVFGVGQTSLLHTDASKNLVGICTNSPTASLDVHGDMNVTGNLVVTGTAEFRETVSIYDNYLLVDKYIGHLGDANTHIQFLDANDLIVITAGSNEMMRLDSYSSQNAVSIGTSGADVDFKVLDSSGNSLIYTDAALKQIKLTGSQIQVSGNMYVSGSVYAEEFVSTTHNHTVINTTLHKSGSTTFGDSPGDQHVFSGSVYTGGNLAVSGTYASHALTVHGDMSGSGKILNVGGIETQGNLGVTGSAVVRGTTILMGTTYVTADLSGSGKILNVGGIETQGDLGVTGSMTVRNMLTHIGDLSGSGKILNVGGIETQGNLGVTGSATARGTITSHAGIGFRLTSSAQNTDYKFVQANRMLMLLDQSAGGARYPWVAYNGKTTIGGSSIGTHPLTVIGDMSGSGKIFNVGGIETAADLGVTGSVTAGNVMPRTDNTYSLGSTSLRWANIYTGDLHLKNDKGDWTILEEEEYLCVINNKTNKKYKMMLQEIED
jgi:hypothetical protein